SRDRLRSPWDVRGKPPPAVRRWFPGLPRTRLLLGGAPALPSPTVHRLPDPLFDQEDYCGDGGSAPGTPSTLVSRRFVREREPWTGRRLGRSVYSGLGGGPGGLGGYEPP